MSSAAFVIHQLKELARKGTKPCSSDIIFQDYYVEAEGIIYRVVYIGLGNRHTFLYDSATGEISWIKNGIRMDDIAAVDATFTRFDLLQ